MIKKIIILTTLFWICMSSPVLAFEDLTLIDDFDFNQVQNVIDGTFLGEEINFGDTIRKMVTGEIDVSLTTIIELLEKSLLADFNNNKILIFSILTIGIIAAVFSNFSSVFTNNQISETAFFITYLLFIGTIATAFYSVSKIAIQTLTLLEEFMQALIPTFFLAVAFASGGTSAVGFYQVTLIMISLINLVLLKISVPFINIYVVLVLINNMNKEDFLSKLIELFHIVIEWMLKTLLALVLGLNIIQSLILPMVDTVKTSVLQKTISVIPGIGSGANAVSQVIIGSGVLIKNGIGTAAFIVIAILVAIPILELCLYALLYQGTAAILQPVSDSRMTDSLSGVCEGAKLLLRCVITAAILFMITIAIICATTNSII